MIVSRFSISSLVPTGADVVVTPSMPRPAVLPARTCQRPSMSPSVLVCANARVSKLALVIDE